MTSFVPFFAVGIKTPVFKIAASWQKRLSQTIRAIMNLAVPFLSLGRRARDALGTFMSDITGGSVFSGYKTPNTFKNSVLEKVMAVSDNEVKIRNVKVIKHSP